MLAPFVLFPVLLLAPVAEAAQDAPPATAAAAATPATAEYRIGPEDVLAISVWQNAELSRAVPVRPDGKISLPLVNDVQAAGLTPMELREALIVKLREFMPTAEVSVVVTEMNSFKVSVIGEVKRSERYRLRGPATVLDVLAMAGGFQDWASRERIVVLPPRSEPAGDSFERIPFDYKKVLAAGGESANFRVQPDDIIVVP
jgi:polysaccharide export outer membrane protein